MVNYGKQYGQPRLTMVNHGLPYGRTIPKKHGSTLAEIFFYDRVVLICEHTGNS